MNKTNDLENTGDVPSSSVFDEDIDGDVSVELVYKEEDNLPIEEQEQSPREVLGYLQGAMEEAQKEEMALLEAARQRRETGERKLPKREPFKRESSRETVAANVTTAPPLETDPLEMVEDGVEDVDTGTKEEHSENNYEEEKIDDKDKIDTDGTEPSETEPEPDTKEAPDVKIVRTEVTTEPVILDERFLRAVEKMLNDGRRYFGSSGASLTHEVYNNDGTSGISVSSAEVGLKGERETSALLRSWIETKPDVVLVDSVKIPGLKKDYFEYITEKELEEREDKDLEIQEGGDSDHVLIMGDTLVIIDSKHWKGKKWYSVTDNGEIRRSNRKFPGGNVKAMGAKHIWKSYVKDIKDIFVRYIIAITQTDVSIKRDHNWWKSGFWLVSHTDLIEFCEKAYEEAKTRSNDPSKNLDINSELVALVVLGAVKPYDVYREKLGSTYDRLTQDFAGLSDN